MTQIQVYMRRGHDRRYERLDHVLPWEGAFGRWVESLQFPVGTEVLLTTGTRAYQYRVEEGEEELPCPCCGRPYHRTQRTVAVRI